MNQYRCTYTSDRGTTYYVSVIAETEQHAKEMAADTAYEKMSSYRMTVSK